MITTAIGITNSGEIIPINTRCNIAGFQFKKIIIASSSKDWYEKHKLHLFSSLAALDGTIEILKNNRVVVGTRVEVTKGPGEVIETRMNSDYPYLIKCDNGHTSWYGKYAFRKLDGE